MATQTMPEQPSRRSPFVGRKRELAFLRERLDSATRGDGGVLLIAGEPGIGKTRLIAEFGSCARSIGWPVLTGRAYDTETMPPYIPFAEAINQHLQDASNKEKDWVAEAAPEIVPLVPELWGREQVSEPKRSHAPETERYRLFESIARFFLQAAKTSPAGGLLLCLDDLHWADASSLLLFLHIARKLKGAPLLVVGSYRPEEVKRPGFLFNVLAEMTRERLDQRLVLDGISPAEADLLIEQAGGAAPVPELSAAIYRQTRGNPFFVEEVVKQLATESRSLTEVGTAQTDWVIPESVREVIDRRLARLSPVARRLLQAASVLGEGFSLRLVSKLLGDEADAIDGLEEAIEQSLMKEDSGTYVFVHPLVRRAVYDGLSLARRQALHLVAAREIEALYAPDLIAYLPSLAFHYRLAGKAGEPEQALHYAVRAADAASAACAYEDSIRLYETAKQIFDNSSAGSGPQHCDLLLGLARALIPAGEHARALQEVLPEAFSLAEASHDNGRAREACLLAIEGFQRQGKSISGFNPMYRRWVERAHQYVPEATADRITAVLAEAQEKIAEQDFRHARRLGLSALGLARALNSEAGLCLATGLLGQIAAFTLRHSDEVLSLTDEIGTARKSGMNDRALAWLLCVSGELLLCTGNRIEAEARWRRLDDLIAASRDAYVCLEAFWRDLRIAFTDGRLQACVDAASQMSALAEELHSPLVALQYSFNAAGRALLYLDRADEALALLCKLQDVAGIRTDRPGQRAFRALCLAKLGNRKDARATINEALGTYWPYQEPGSAPPEFAGDLIEASTMVGDRDSAARLIPYLEPFSSLTTRRGASVARQIGGGMVLLGRRSEAIGHFRQAIDLGQRIGLRPDLALTNLQLGEVLIRGSIEERQAGLAHLDFAIAELEAMGMPSSLERALRLRGRRSSNSAKRSYPCGLTEREVEVLRLIAAGRSNREIADGLVLSVRTVGRHVTNIYAKIDARGKADATAFALRHSLL